MITCRHAKNAPESLQEELAADRRRWPLRSTAIGEFACDDRRRTGTVSPYDRPACQIGPRRLVEGDLRNPDTRIGAYPQRRFVALGPGRCRLVLLFPHPLLWWLRRAIRGDQELLADAAAAGDNRPAYAEELLRLVRKTAYPSPIAASVAVGIMGKFHPSFQGELPCFWTRISVSSRDRRAVGGIGFWAVLVILGAACSLLTLQPTHSVGQPSSPPPPAGEGQTAKAINSPRPYPGEGQRVRESNSETASPQRNTYAGSTTVVVGTMTYDSATAADELIVLPGYRLRLLMKPAVCKELKLTPEQRQKLRDWIQQFHRLVEVRWRGDQDQKTVFG